ncbi:MAG: hypothetical protein LAN84_04175 [Acidobacteriia bacterium]|nr:hypothetical protein [Terriglobia bacterium]
MEYADYVKTGIMPPAIMPDESEEERKRKLIASAGGLSVMPPVSVRPNARPAEGLSGDAVKAAMDAARGGAMPTREGFDPDFLQRALTIARPQAGVATPAPVTPAQPQSAAPSTSMPPVPISAPAPRSGAFSGAPATPIMPPARVSVPPEPPPGESQGMPPVNVPIQKAPAAPSQTMPPVQLTDAQRYEELHGKEPNRADFPAEKMPLWKKILGLVSAGAAGFNRHDNTTYDLTRQVLGAPEAAAEKKYGQAEDIWKRGLDAIQKESGLKNTESEMRRRDVETARLQDQPEKSTDKKIDEYVNDKGQRVLTFQRADNSTYDKVGGKAQEKQTGHTSPFEAFAYGSPEEKKAAQDFLDMEKRLGSRYRTPSEFEEKYRLFKEDPDTYKAMFGEKPSGGPDKATATKMLNYFDRRRREVQGDFTLDDAQKQEQLRDIENLEKPLFEAVQPGRTDRGGEDRVNVIGPDGTPGTIPRSQLDKAKRKRYRVAH